MKKEIIATTEMDQINPETGVSADYINAFMSITMLKDDDYTLEEWCLNKKQSPIQRYTERYDPRSYKNVVNEKNENAISRLDSLVDRLNQIANNPGLSSKADVIKLLKEAHKIIYGQELWADKKR